MDFVESILVQCRPEISVWTTIIRMDTYALHSVGIVTESRGRYITLQIVGRGDIPCLALSSFCLPTGIDITRREELISYITPIIEQMMRNEWSVIVKPVLDELRHKLLTM